MRALLRLAPLALSSVWVVASCVGDEEPAPPLPLPALSRTAPDAPGPYRVGVRTIEAGTGDRIFPVEVWYPANPAEGAEPTRYPLIVGVLELASLDSPLGAVRDAPLALEGAPHPAIVFSHGFMGLRTQSVYLTEYLASHGFVVAAPDHVGNTLQDASMPAGQSAVLRPEDVSQTLDALLEASATWRDPLELAVDPSRVGVAGHSFGGFTALRIAGATVDAAAVAEACAATDGGFVCPGWDGTMPKSQRDDRFIAALAQTPGGDIAYEPDGYADVAVPMMFHGGTHDQTTPLATEVLPPYEGVPSPAWLVTLEGAGHFTFSDVCTLTDGLGLDIEQLSDGCGDDDIAPALAHALANRYATAFFELTLEGDASARAWLDPAAPLPDGVAELRAK